MDTFGIVWITSIIITTLIASIKGDGITGFFAGCMFGPIGIPVALAISGNNGKSQIVKELYSVVRIIIIMIFGIIIIFLCVQTPIIGVPLVILSIYKYQQKRKGRMSEDRRSYEKDAEKQSEKADLNDNDEDINASYQENRQANDKPESDNKLRILLCPSCNQKIRVRLPLPKSIGKCTSCQKRFEVSSDNAGNLYIYSVINDQNDNYEQVLTIDDCFSILQVNKTAPTQVIKAAYRKKILEYHPDKVSKLGEELKQLAEAKTKKINAAYGLLKRNGYIK